MRPGESLESLSREQLLELLSIYSKNWQAMDGVWFQSGEEKFGMDEAMLHDKRAWERFTAIEARRIKSFLDLPEHPGLEGLAQVLSLLVPAENGVRQGTPVLLHRDNGHPQGLLRLLQGHVVQKHVFPVAEHVEGDQQPLPQLPPLHLPDQVLSRYQA